MARFLRVLLKLAIVGGILAVVVKVLQNRSHPDPVVDRNAYNSWEPLTDTTPVAPVGADEGAAAKKGAVDEVAAAKKAAVEQAEAATADAIAQGEEAKAAAEKAPAKKAPAK
ncbi:MAG: hypothetical protein KDB35_17190, partial [Acidimicrobiales bacterium]|nr:hypothetical protein [Acidimicrobiales bacterium]